MDKNEEEYYTRKIRLINGFMHWFPRIWILVFAILLFLFALLSGIEKSGGGISGIAKNFPNAIPWIFLFVIVYISWKWEKIGGWMLIIFSLIATIFFGLYKNPQGFAFIIFPILLPGILFLANAYQNYEP